MAQYAALSHAECNAIHILREMADDKTRKAVKAQIFSRAKVQFGIPVQHKLVVETDVTLTNAGNLKNKETRELYPLDPATGKWVGAATNGTNDDKAWFKLPANQLRDAVGEQLDAMEANGENIVRHTAKPADAAVHPHDAGIAITNDGAIWIHLDADTYGTHDEESEDDVY